MTTNTDTDKLIEVLEEELTYIRGECERWHTLYVEEAKIRIRFLDGSKHN